MVIVVCLEVDELSFQIEDIPETVFHMADDRQPGKTTTGIVSRVVVFGEDPPNHIFIKCISSTTRSFIAPKIRINGG